jgi:hypothetical protein
MKAAVIYIAIAAFFLFTLLISIIKPSRCKGRKGGFR